MSVKERPDTKPPWAAGILIGLLVAAFVACSTEPQPTATPAPDTDQFDLPDVLIQFDYEPTFSTPERFAPFGRVPPFTLLEDGTLIYLDEGGRYDEQRVMEVRLSGDDVEALVQQVLDLGFERLENYSEQCQNVSNQQKWDTVGAERSGAGWRSGELPEGPVVASSLFDRLSLHLLPAL